MRLTPVLAGVASAFVAASGTGARSDDASPSPPPKFNLWNRPGIWTTTTQKNSAFQIGDMAWGQADAEGAPTGIVTAGYTPVGRTSVVHLVGVTTGSGRGVRGTGGTLDQLSKFDKFAVKMVDTARYEQFAGTYWAASSHGVHFSGTYQPGPVEQETGTANLRLLLSATKPAGGHPGTQKVTALHRKDLPASVVLDCFVQNTGPDLLPRGVAKMQITVTGGRALGLALPFAWSVDRIVDPKPSYHALDSQQQYWVQEATIGALGSTKDRAAFAFQVDVPQGFLLDRLNAELDVVSNAPGYSITTQDIHTTTPGSKATISIPILND